MVRFKKEVIDSIGKAIRDSAMLCKIMCGYNGKIKGRITSEQGVGTEVHKMMDDTMGLAFTLPSLRQVQCTYVR